MKPHNERSAFLICDLAMFATNFKHNFSLSLKALSLLLGKFEKEKEFYYYARSILIFIGSIKDKQKNKNKNLIICAYWKFNDRIKKIIDYCENEPINTCEKKNKIKKNTIYNDLALMIEEKYNNKS